MRSSGGLDMLWVSLDEIGRYPRKKKMLRSCWREGGGSTTTTMHVLEHVDFVRHAKIFHRLLPPFACFHAAHSHSPCHRLYLDFTAGLPLTAFPVCP